MLAIRFICESHSVTIQARKQLYKLNLIHIMLVVVEDRFVMHCILLN